LHRVFKEGMRSYLVYLSRHKLYTAINILGKTLAFAVGLLAMSFIVKHYFTDSQHQKADRIYILGCDKGNWSNYWLGQYAQKAFGQEIERTTAIANFSDKIIRGGQTAEQNVILVDSTFFDIFTYQITSGDINKFRNEGRHAVISEEYARATYGEDNPIGKELWLRGRDYEVVALMDPPNNTVLDADIIATGKEYITVNMFNDRELHTLGNCMTIMLLRDGVDIETFEQRLNDYFREKILILQSGFINRLRVDNFREAYFGNGYGGLFRQGNYEGIMLLIVIVIALIVFAGCNYVSLNLMLSANRARQMAIRQLVGTSKVGIMLRLMRESALMSGICIILGTTLAWGLSEKASQMLDFQFMVFDEFRWYHYLLVLALYGVATLAANIAPTIAIIRSNPLDVVKNSIKSRVARGGIIMALQYAICFTMLIPTLCMWKQTMHLKNASLGYETKDRLVLEPNMDIDPAELKNTLMQLESVEQVGFCSSIPLDAVERSVIRVDGEDYYLSKIMGDSTFLSMMGIRKYKTIKDGPQEEYRRDGNDVFVHININKAAAKLINVDENNPQYTTFMGNMRGHIIVHDIYEDLLVGNVLDNNIFASITNWGSNMDHIAQCEVEQVVVKTRGNHDKAHKEIRDACVKLYKERWQPQKEEYIDTLIDETYSTEQRVLNIGLAFAAVSIFLSVMGMFASAVMGINNKRHDIAIRRVCGQSVAMISKFIGIRFMIMMSWAYAISLPFAYYMCEKWLNRFSYRIEHPYSLYLIVYIVAATTMAAIIFILTEKVATENPAQTIKK